MLIHFRAEANIRSMPLSYGRIAESQFSIKTGRRGKQLSWPRFKNTKSKKLSLKVANEVVIMYLLNPNRNRSENTTSCGVEVSRWNSFSPGAVTSWSSCCHRKIAWQPAKTQRQNFRSKAVK